MKLKLVNAERYVCHLIGPDVIVKGQVVEVDEATSKVLLDDVRVDSLNNEHPVWVEVDDDTPVGEETDEDEEADDKPASKKAAAPAQRRRSK